MISVPKLCAALTVVAQAMNGTTKVDYKLFEPVRINALAEGVTIAVRLFSQNSLPYQKNLYTDLVTISGKTLKDFAAIFGADTSKVKDGDIWALNIYEATAGDLVLHVYLENGAICAAAGVQNAKDISLPEIFTSFKQAYERKKPLVIASIAALENVSTDFKTDGHGLIVGPDGTFYDVTPVDRRQEFKANIAANIDESGYILSHSNARDAVILTDATNNRLVISNTLGNIVGLDLRGYRPFTIDSAKLLLSTSYIESSLTGPVASDVASNIVELGLNRPTNWLAWLRAVAQNPDNRQLQTVQAKLEQYWQQLLSQPQTNGMSYYQYTCIFRPLLKSLVFYARDVLDYEKKLNMQETFAFNNSVPNLPGVTGLMPHQIDVLAKTSNSKLNVLQVGTGGGKSLLTIADCASKLKEGLIKKPLIIMPTKLLGQYASEIFNFSQNKLNAFVYGRDTAAGYKKAYDMKRNAIEDADKNLPPNTIYLVGYDLLKSQKDWSGNTYTKYYLGQEQETYPIAEYLAQQGFDAVYLDEAHKIKNESGRLSKVVRSILTGVNYITCMSGTLIYNNIKDLESIVSVCAPETSRIDYESEGYLNAMKSMNISFVAKEPKDWAAFLPKFKEYLIPVHLPEAYDEAYKNAENEILSQLIDDPKLAEYKAYLSGESDVELDDNQESQLEFIMNMRFNKLETVINAPDTVPGLGNVPSPKVKVFDDIVSAHEANSTYNGIDFSKSKGKKIFAFGYNKNVSAHIMKWSKHKDIISWYHGDKSVITAFLSDPRKKVLLADITSMAEGWNLQTCDTCICLQSLFTPGMLQQAIARVFRPKVGDISRPVVNNITIAVNNTVDMIKFARMLYKKTMVNSVYYANDPGYKRLALDFGLENLPRVSLSMKSIAEYENDAMLDKMGFFRAATALNDWNSKIIDQSKQRLIKQSAERLGIPEESVNLATDILVPVHHSEDISGSATVWTAKPQGFTVNSTLLTLEQAIANLLSDYDGDESGEKQMLKTALQGAKVITSFGRGTIYRVATARSKPASTITIGSNNIVLANSEIFMDDGGDESEIVLNKIQAKPVKPVIPVKELADEVTTDDIEDDLANDDSGLDLYPGIVNNQAALVDTEGYGLDGFVNLGPLLYSKIKNKQAIARLEKFVAETDKLTFNPDIIDELNKAKSRMISPAKAYATESKFYPKIKKWTRLQKLPQKEKIIEPFIVYVEDEAILCISLKHSKHARKLLGKKFVTGMTPFKAQSNFYVLFAKGPNNLAKQLKKIETEYNLNNAEEVYELASKIKVKSKI